MVQIVSDTARDTFVFLCLVIGLTPLRFLEFKNSKWATRIIARMKNAKTLTKIETQPNPDIAAHLSLQAKL